MAPGSVPFYQSDVHPLSFPDAKGVGHYGRGTPDVAALAEGNGGWVGTSASTPTFASLIARINIAIGINVEFIHPIIYALGDATTAFRKITRGNNIPPVQMCSKMGWPQNGYTAKMGWDACTGLGVPNGKALKEALLSALQSGDQFGQP